VQSAPLQLARVSPQRAGTARHGLQPGGDGPGSGRDGEMHLLCATDSRGAARGATRTPRARGQRSAHRLPAGLPYAGHHVRIAHEPGRPDSPAARAAAPLPGPARARDATARALSRDNHEPKSGSRSFMTIARVARRIRPAARAEARGPWIREATEDLTPLWRHSFGWWV